jgi:lysophospholipase L1-like esterase
MFKNATRALIFAALAAFPSMAQDFKPTPPPVDLSDGDVVVFIGDSITHQCLYTQYVEDYFYTRYPEKRIQFRNAGVGGDTAHEVLVRFDNDIAAFKPTYTTILIGMNDGDYTDFSHETFGRYKQDMTTLLDRLDALGAAAIPMTPTMYDLRQVLREDGKKDSARMNEADYNATLSLFGMWCLRQANARGLGFVNMFEPLNRVTREQRAHDPNFTLIRDSVHPDAPGQLVMALALLEDIGASPVVSTIEITQENGRWLVEADGGTVSEVDDDSIAFTFTADSLPWIIPEEGRLGFEITNAAHRMSRETLQVFGLDSDEYELRINGKVVGTFARWELAQGVALQELDRTPQYAQALRVAELNKLRNDEAVRPIRDRWAWLKEMRLRNSELKAGIHEEEDEESQLGDWRRPFTDEKLAAFEIEHKKVTAELEKKAKVMEDAIFRINTPEPHRYELVPVN